MAPLTGIATVFVPRVDATPLTDPWFGTDPSHDGWVDWTGLEVFLQDL